MTGICDVISKAKFNTCVAEIYTEVNDNGEETSKLTNIKIVAFVLFFVLCFFL